MFSREAQFYERIKRYWENPPSLVKIPVDYPDIHDVAHTCDIKESSEFIAQFLQDRDRPLGRRRALDCGSGIGRITKHLLATFFRRVDMLDQNRDFLFSSFDYLEDYSNVVGGRYSGTLQNFVPEKSYDLIWIQWTMGYLLHSECINTLVSLKESLHENGLVIIKDNVVPRESSIMHNDGSILRSRESFERMFLDAGMTLVAERKQISFPDCLYDVTMFALR